MILSIPLLLSLIHMSMNMSISVQMVTYRAISSFPLSLMCNEWKEKGSTIQKWNRKRGGWKESMGWRKMNVKAKTKSRSRRTCKKEDRG